MWVSVALVGAAGEGWGSAIPEDSECEVTYHS
jgi:hypothetical protein